jgi:hypothetical protein
MPSAPDAPRPVRGRNADRWVDVRDASRQDERVSVRRAPARVGWGAARRALMISSCGARHAPRGAAGARRSLKRLLTLSVGGADSASADAFHWRLPEISTIPGRMPRGDHVASHCRRSRLLWPRTSTTAPQFEMILLSMRSGRAPTWGRHASSRAASRSSEVPRFLDLRRARRLCSDSVLAEDIVVSTREVGVSDGRRR